MFFIRAQEALDGDGAVIDFKSSIDGLGNFNSIKEDGERIGGQPLPLAAVEDFNNCINNCGTVKIRTMGGNVSFFEMRWKYVLV